MNSTINQLIESFSSDLMAALREHALTEVTSLLNGVSVEPARHEPRAKALTNGSAPKRIGRPKGKGAKRTPEQLEALTKNLLAQVKKTPGESIEAIGKALGVSTKELALPVQKLFAEKAIRTRGQRRATKYFVK